MGGRRFSRKGSKKAQAAHHRSQPLDGEGSGPRLVSCTQQVNETASRGACRGRTSQSTHAATQRRSYHGGKFHSEGSIPDISWVCQAWPSEPNPGAPHQPFPQRAGWAGRQSSSILCSSRGFYSKGFYSAEQAFCLLPAHPARCGKGRCGAPGLGPVSAARLPGHRHWPQRRRRWEQAPRLGLLRPAHGSGGHRPDGRRNTRRPRGRSRPLGRGPSTRE